MLLADEPAIWLQEQAGVPPAYQERAPMHDAMIAALFVLMLFSPCLVTMEGMKKKPKK